MVKPTLFSNFLWDGCESKPMEAKMKTLKAVVAFGLFTLGGLLPGAIEAQILVGGATDPAATPLASVPSTGTFFSAQLNIPPWPTDWLPQLAVYAGLSSNIFIVDDRGWDYSASGNAMFATSAQTGGMGAMVSGAPPPPGGTNSGGTNSAGGVSMPMVQYTTNDLYLEIAPSSNATSASLVLHTPWYVTNGVYNILTTTNLAPPIVWQWFMTTTPGQTIIPLTNEGDPQRFFALGATNSSSGTDFWVAFVNGAGLGGYYWLNFTTQVSNSIRVSGGITTSFILMPATMNGILLNDLLEEVAIPNYDATNVGFTFHITASQQLSVYGMDFYPEGSWAFTAFPTPMLGTNYCLMARPSLSGDSYTSQFAIVATAEGAIVTINPSTNANLATSSGGSYSNSYRVALTNGQSYQVSSGTITNDVTGTWITSDNPIAVFAGAGNALVPYELTESGNPLVQEQLPVCSWGTQALSLSFAGRTNGDTYRVLAATNGAQVTVWSPKGVFTTNLGAGQFFDTNLGGWAQFQANKPIQVAQFPDGYAFDGTNNNEGDPLEMLLPPTRHYLTSYTITIPADFGDTGDFDQNFVNLIVPQSAISTTMMDGTNISTNNFLQIGQSGYSGARISVPPGSTNTIRSTQPIEVQAYGWGPDDAYGYIGGASSFP